MKPHQTFGEIKAYARGALAGHYGVAIMTLIDVMLIYIFPTYIVGYLFPGSSMLEIIGSELVNFILSCFIGILEAGLCLIYLKLCAGEQATLFDLFYGYRNSQNHILLISLVSSIISEVCLMPFMVINTSNMINGVYAPMTEYLVFMAGIAAAFFLRLPIVQSFFIIIDFPDCTGVDALKQSMKLMKDNYGRYILFMLSYLPLFVLSVTSFFIGFLWTIPYAYSGKAAFYLELAKSKREQ